MSQDRAHREAERRRQIARERRSQFSADLDKLAEQIRQANTELEGLWGQGTLGGAIDKNVLDSLRGRTRALDTQIQGLQRLASGELE